MVLTDRLKRYNFMLGFESIFTESAGYEFHGRLQIFNFSSMPAKTIC